MKKSSRKKTGKLHEPLAIQEPMTFAQLAARLDNIASELDEIISMVEEQGDSASVGGKSAPPDDTARTFTAGRLHDTVKSAVLRLNKLAWREPELFQGSSGEDGWPVWYSEHPFVKGQIESLYRKLRVGEASPWSNNQHSKSYPPDPATAFMVELVANVSRQRHLGRFFTVKVPLHDCPPWASEARALPPLSRSTAGAWWAVCRSALDDAFPRIDERPEFAHIDAGNSSYRRRASIKDRIKSRFFSNLKSSMPKLRPST